MDKSGQTDKTIKNLTVRDRERTGSGSKKDREKGVVRGKRYSQRIKERHAKETERGGKQGEITV